MYSISTNVKFDGKSNTSLMSHIIPVKSIDDLSNRVEIIEGDKNQKSPKKGEVWIPSTLADSKDLDIGKNIEIIDFKGKKINFKIAAIVNDSIKTIVIVLLWQLMIYLNIKKVIL